jgi:hypothetical protein
MAPKKKYLINVSKDLVYANNLPSNKLLVKFPFNKSINESTLKDLGKKSSETRKSKIGTDIKRSKKNEKIYIYKSRFFPSNTRKYPNNKSKSDIVNPERNRNIVPKTKLSEIKKKKNIEVR